MAVRMSREADPVVTPSLISTTMSFSSWPRRVLIGVVRGYRLLLSPWLGSVCRFEPTCSAYSLRALELHGARMGTYLTLGRLLRCHPWCDGGHDPVPDAPRTLFSSLVPSSRKKTSP